METLHPAAVHFAIVLPFVALTMQFLFIRTQNSVYSKAALVTLLFTALFVLFAWYTGKGDAKDAFEALMANTENGAEILKGHGAMGQYLMIGMLVIAALKLATLKFKQPILELIVLAALVIATPTMMFQGKSGGEIVYKNGSLFDYPETDDGE